MFSLPLFPSHPHPPGAVQPGDTGEGVAASRRHRHRKRLSLLRRRLRPAIYTKGGKVIDIEGNPRQPHQRGHALSQGRQHFPARPSTRTESQHVLYRAPYSDHWERSRSTGRLDRIAERVKEARDAGFRRASGGRPSLTQLNIGTLGGATLDNEENYLIKKLFGGGLGVVSIENQARI